MTKFKRRLEEQFGPDYYSGVPLYSSGHRGKVYTGTLSKQVTLLLLDSMTFGGLAN